MKKFVKTLLVAMFALPLAACGEEDPVNPPVDWSRYLNPQGGNVEVDNNGEIDFVNKATEQLPEGYSIITLGETKVDEAGVYNVTYAIVDENGNVVYQTTVTYNVTLNYSGIRYDAEFTSTNHETGEIDFNINNSGYLWRAGSNGYLTIDMDGSYSTFVVDFKEIYTSITELFECESKEAESTVSKAVIPSSLLDIDWSEIIELLEPVISYVIEVYSKYASDLYVVVDNLTDLTRTITFNTEKCALMFEEIVTPLVEYELITAEEVQTYVDFIKKVDLKVTLSGYELSGQTLSGDPDSIELIVDFYYPKFGLDARAILLGDLTYNPDNGESYLSLNGRFELDIIFNRGTEDETAIPFMVYKAGGNIVANNEDKVLNVELYEVSPFDEDQKILIATLEASYQYDAENSVVFDLNDVTVNYRTYDTSYYLLLDFTHANYEFAKCYHEGLTDRCSFYNKQVDTIDTLAGYVFFKADLSFAEPEISLLIKNKTARIGLYFDLEGASFSYVDLTNNNVHAAVIDFEEKSVLVDISLDYFELGEDKDPHYGMEFSIKLSFVKLPDGVIESAKDAKGIDYLIDTAKVYLSLLA